MRADQLLRLHPARGAAADCTAAQSVRHRHLRHHPGSRSARRYAGACTGPRSSRPGPAPTRPCITSPTSICTTPPGERAGIQTTAQTTGGLRITRMRCYGPRRSPKGTVGSLPPASLLRSPGWRSARADGGPSLRLRAQAACGPTRSLQMTDASNSSSWFVAESCHSTSSVIYWMLSRWLANLGTAASHCYRT